MVLVGLVHSIILDDHTRINTHKCCEFAQAKQQQTVMDILVADIFVYGIVNSPMTVKYSSDIVVI